MILCCSERLSATECRKHPWLAFFPRNTDHLKESWSSPEPIPIDIESPEEFPEESDSETDRELSTSFDLDIQLREAFLGDEENDPPLSSPRSGSSDRLTGSDSACHNHLDMSELEDSHRGSRSRSSSSRGGLSPSLSPSPVGHFTSSSRYNQKRGSLDLTKDHLKTFVSRWTDNPYLFDRPRGIITHLYGASSEVTVGSRISASRSQGGSDGHVVSTSALGVVNNHRADVNPGSIKCGMNIVSQIRKFSHQLHEELQIMKSHHHHKCSPALRKCSWGEVNAQ